MKQTNIKINHIYRWIELTIVVIVITILAVIVIPTITSISKSADYSKAYNCSTTIIKIFDIAHADAKFQTIVLPDTETQFTSGSLNEDIADDTTDNHYRNFIAKQLYTYLSNTDNIDLDFTFKLVTTPTLVVLYYWDKPNEITIPDQLGYRNPDYICYQQNQTTKFLTYNEFIKSDLYNQISS